jgi:hypothetical protein
MSTRSTSPASSNSHNISNRNSIGIDTNGHNTTKMNNNIDTGVVNDGALSTTDMDVVATEDAMQFIAPPSSLSSTSLRTDFSDAFSALGDIEMSPGLLPDFNAELPNMDYFMSSVDAYFDVATLAPCDSVSMPSTRQGSVTCSEGCPGGCLAQALDLLKSVSVSSGNLPQALLLENKMCTDTVSRMLSCSCTEDGFLLTVLSMIVLKVLGRYASAAGRDAAGRHIGGPFTPGYGTFRADECELECDDQQRIAAQSVLGELHRVQRLVNQLSPRLKTPREVGIVNSGGNGTLGMTGDSCRDDTSTAPFSASTMDQIGSDLRKSLSALSLGIIHNLRQR